MIIFATQRVSFSLFAVFQYYSHQSLDYVLCPPNSSRARCCLIHTGTPGLQERLHLKSICRNRWPAYPAFSSLLLAALLFWTASASAKLAVPYEVTIEGVSDKSLLQLLESVSNTVAYKAKPPATLSLLDHRARTDIPEMTQALRSMGYYACDVRVKITDASQPPQVLFQVVPGPVYQLKSVTMAEVTEIPEAHVPVKMPSPEDLGLRLNTPARARVIIDAGAKLTHSLKKQGFPFATIRDHKVVVDHATQTVTVTYMLDAGKRANFGRTTVSGLHSVKESYVNDLLAWHEGDLFSADLLTQTEKKLVETRLFSLVQFKPAATLDEAGRLPIALELKERMHRTISAGASYHTDEGPGAKVSWEHRNLLHGGELLKIEGAVSGFGFSGEGVFKKPRFFRNDQTLSITSRLARDDTNAFVSENMDSAVLVEREIRKGMRFGMGPAFRISKVDPAAEQGKGEEEFVLASFRFFFNWDTTDNLLDPAKGGRLEVQFAPYINTGDIEASFTRGRVSYSRYIKLSEKPNLLLAGRTAFGTINGTDRDSVPADLRLYEGGGGFVRGYAFQLVGPLVGDAPIGGKSSVEVNMELRAKITDTIGAVAFVDGGSVYKSSFPNFETAMRWGGGTGLRYFTPIGPLRIDFAVPINPRENVDDPFQIYLSIGQAF